MEDLLLLIMVLQEKLKANIIDLFRNNAGYYILDPAIFILDLNCRDSRVSIQNKSIE